MTLKFIDLFAGLGGFHVGLRRLGMECVFASELKKDLQALYKVNHHLAEVHGDIKPILETDIPAHDFLCAGFPCQPFSKAGSQEGLQDEVRGNLFFDILRIVHEHKPKYLLLENVANLRKHDGGKTWEFIEAKLKDEGYEIDEKVLSPHQFDVPQLRQRMFIVGIHKSAGGLKDFAWPEVQPTFKTIHSILEPNLSTRRPITNGEENALNIWQEFLALIPKDEPLPSFPIWMTEYKATYPFEGQVPGLMSEQELEGFTGIFGESLAGLNRAQQLSKIPTYSHKEELFPKWKQLYIRQNREFLTRYEKVLEPIIDKLKSLPFSWQKFEWNCKFAERDIKKLIIQFRPSGIRVKHATYAPTLVAFTRTQVPAIGWEWGYMTPQEASKLQSLDGIILPSTETAAFKALGNAVNAEVVYQIAMSMVSCVLPKEKPELEPRKERGDTNKDNRAKRLKKVMQPSLDFASVLEPAN